MNPWFFEKVESFDDDIISYYFCESIDNALNQAGDASAPAGKPFPESPQPNSLKDLQSAEKELSAPTTSNNTDGVPTQDNIFAQAQSDSMMSKLTPGTTATVTGTVV